LIVEQPFERRDITRQLRVPKFFLGRKDFVVDAH
jgi:hypothetical protein